jgi:uncharacterized membrane protein YfcA
LLREFWILIPAVFATATLSGAVGMGGGVILLGVMANLLPPPAVVPLHGVVQLVSNATRSLRLLRSVRWSLVGLYVPALLVGAFLALQIYSGEKMSWFRPAIGIFILAFLAWDRFRPRRLILPKWVFAPAGLGGGFLTILVGATGPYLATFFLRDDLDRKEIVATKAAIQMIGHLVKIPAFLSVGFSYGQHVGLLVPLIVCAVLGTLMGTWILGRMGQRGFGIFFRVVLGLLAVRLILQAWL